MLTGTILHLQIDFGRKAIFTVLILAILFSFLLVFSQTHFLSVINVHCRGLPSASQGKTSSGLQFVNKNARPLATMRELEQAKEGVETPRHYLGA